MNKFLERLHPVRLSLAVMVGWLMLAVGPQLLWFMTTGLMCWAILAMPSWSLAILAG